MEVKLSKDEFKIVESILHNFFPIYEVWAFGSRVSGKSKPFSDLDLVIISSEPIGVSLIANAKDAFGASNLPFRVDILDWSRLSDSFRLIIEEQKSVIKNAQA